MSEDNIAIRLKFLITDLGITSSTFADKCGISRATLSQLLTGRNKKINDILISQIHKAYPDLSILWLLFNEGKMWNRETEGLDTQIPSSSTDSEPSTTKDTISADMPSSLNPNSNSTKNLAEIPDLSSNGTDFFENENDAPLKLTPKNTHNTLDQEISARLRTASLMSEIEVLRSKIKKVVQITIYYDDSTFESFYPK